MTVEVDYDMRVIRWLAQNGIIDKQLAFRELLRGHIYGDAVEMPNIYKIHSFNYEVTTCGSEIEPCRRDWLYDLEPLSLGRCLPVDEEGRVTQCNGIAALRLQLVDSKDTYPLCAACWEIIERSYGRWVIGRDPRIKIDLNDKLVLPDDASVTELYHDPVHSYESDREEARRHFTALVERRLRIDPQRCKESAVQEEFKNIKAFSTNDLRGYYDAVKDWDPPIAAVITATQQVQTEPAWADLWPEFTRPAGLADQYSVVPIPPEPERMKVWPLDHIRMHYTIGSAPSDLKHFIGELATDVRTEHPCEGPNCPWCEILNAGHPKDE